MYNIKNPDQAMIKTEIIKILNERISKAPLGMTSVPVCTNWPSM